MGSIAMREDMGADVKMTKGNGSWLGRSLTVVGLGLAGLVLGGFPYWAAKRVIYPVLQEPMPSGANEGLAIELSSDAQPEYAVYASRNGGELSGWFVPGPSATKKPWPCILLLYGYGGYKEQMVYYASMLHEAGFASFMFDMEGSGLKSSAPVTMGFKERWDTLDALDYIASRPDVDANRIGALGVSMGAATALLAAEQDTRIKSIVSDSAYADLTRMIQPGLRAFVGSPAAMLSPLIVRWAEQMLHMKTRDVRPDVSASKLGKRPLFIIHGANDVLTDPQSARSIYDAASGPKELWIVPNCEHARAPEVAFDEYKSRVNQFFTDTLR